jgi:heme iron utilization protein
MLVELAKLEPILRDLFAAQRYAVLGTRGAGDAGASGISLNLMAVAVSGDLRALILVTERATRKYANMHAQPRVSVMVDNRTNRAADTERALALRVDGQAEEVGGPEREPLVRAFLERNPQLETLARSPSSALFRVWVERYELVRGLYDVTEVRLT